MDKQEYPYVFGIDHGTNNSCVSVTHGVGNPGVVSIGGKYTMPPVVALTRSSSHVRARSAHPLGHETTTSDDTLCETPHRKKQY